MVSLQIKLLLCALLAAPHSSSSQQGEKGEATPVKKSLLAQLEDDSSEADISWSSDGSDMGGNSAGEAELKWGINYLSNLHYRVEDKSVGNFYNREQLPVGFARFDNSIQLRGSLLAGDYTAVLDVDFDFIEYPNRYGALENLATREALWTSRLKTNAAFIEAINFGLDGLDLRVGHQRVQWGAGDRFNPTHNLNPNDLENPLLFGEQAANFMVKADYGLSDFWTVSFVMVPLFKPAILPKTGRLAVTAVDRIPVVDEAMRLRLHAARETAYELGPALFGGDPNPTVVSAVNYILPKANYQNMQNAFRVSGTIFDQDVALSYYRGRYDFPVAVENNISMGEGLCNPDDSEECVDKILNTEVTLAFPRIQVLGLNMSGEVGPLGYRLEVGVYFPEERRLRIYNHHVVLAGQERDGEYDYGTEGNKPPVVVESTPFAKWSLGLDYTINRFVYLNAMWVHGFPDEFGAGDFINPGTIVRTTDNTAEFNQLTGCFNSGVGSYEPGDEKECVSETVRSTLGDYVVFGTDFRFWESRALLRVFAIVELSGYERRSWDEAKGERVVTKFSPFSVEGRSMILFPELGYNFGNGFEWSIGGLVTIGEEYTKFADPAVGGSLLWSRVQLRY